MSGCGLYTAGKTGRGAMCGQRGPLAARMRGRFSILDARVFFTSGASQLRPLDVARAITGQRARIRPLTLTDKRST